MDEQPIAGGQNNFMIPISILIGALIIGGAIYFSNSKKAVAPAGTAKAEPAVAPDISKVVMANEPVVGDPNAKVTIAYWFDYQCPYCKLSEQKNISKIVDQYVKTGKVKIVFKDFQFLGGYSQDPTRDDSMSAATMARAVWEVAPDKFYDWHSAVMNAQDKENADWGSQADLIALTKTIAGIDVAKVQSLIVSKKDQYTKAIVADKAEGVSFGIDGTPGMIIGKKMLGGYIQDYSKITTEIEALLK
jgi:protein-disulfide isomerase